MRKSKCKVLIRKYINQTVLQRFKNNISSGKCSDPVHFLKSQDNFFFISMYPFLHILTPKIINRV